VPTEQTEFLEQGEVEPAGEWEEGDAPVASYFVDLWDNAGADVYERIRSTTAPEWDPLAEHTVAEAMSRRVATLPPDTDVGTAARFLADRRIHRVLVMEGGSLQGVLTTTDIVRAVAAGRLVPARA
jgi:CBS-domain-containing membrane protein